MKNIKLILVAVSLSLVSFNMAFATMPGSTTDSKASAPRTQKCDSCLEENNCITTTQNNVRTLNGTGGNVQTTISPSCMQDHCAKKCSAEIKKDKKRNHESKS